MPRLIHLNGPSRVGKSTLARQYADEHPGVLALDLDVLTGLVGGWREDFYSAWTVARDHGRALATRHLRAGYDVVLPQLVTSYDRGQGFEEAAREAGAAYVEIALLVDERIRRHLAEYLADRPETIRLDTTGLGPDATYGRLLEVLHSPASIAYW